MNIKMNIDINECKPIINWRHATDIDAEHEAAEKWGELLLTRNQILKLVCIKCTCIFYELASFGNHIHDGSCKLQQKSPHCAPSDRDQQSEIVHDFEWVEDEAFHSEEYIIKEEPVLSVASYDEFPRDTDHEEVNTTFIDNFKIALTETADSDSRTPKSKNDVSGESDPKRRSSTKSTQRGKSRSKPLKSERTVEQMPFCAACCRSYVAGFRDHLRRKHSDIITQQETIDEKLEVLEERILQSLDELMCVYCFKVFKEFAELRAHAAQHLGRRIYECKMCDKKFTTPSLRKMHMQIHEGDRPLKCPHCPRDFIVKRNLNDHIKRHLKAFLHKCSCGKDFISNYAKEVHERRHAKVTPFQCEECGRKFITESLLRTHKLRHDNIKPAKCTICDKAFFSNAYLKDHMLTHTKEKKFTCKICNEKFPRRIAQKRHEQLHETVKKYVCNVCGKEFAQFAGLYSHKKSHGVKLK